MPSPTRSGEKAKKGKGVTIAADGGDGVEGGAKKGVPRGRRIADQLRALDPQNAVGGVKNEDMMKLKDRFSGWV